MHIITYFYDSKGVDTISHELGKLMKLRRLNSTK